jgi:hypothetical protein
MQEIAWGLSSILMLIIVAVEPANCAITVWHRL